MMSIGIVGRSSTGPPLCRRGAPNLQASRAQFTRKHTRFTIWPPAPALSMRSKLASRSFAGRVFLEPARFCLLTKLSRLFTTHDPFWGSLHGLVCLQDRSDGIFFLALFYEGSDLAEPAWPFQASRLCPTIRRPGGNATVLRSRDTSMFTRTSVMTAFELEEWGREGPHLWCRAQPSRGRT